MIATTEKLQKQLAFIIEIDKLKTIYRKTKLIHDDRHENDAEHTWHLATMAVVLYPYANEHIDLLKVMKILLVHDIVEIDAGDTFAYDVAGHVDKEEREIKAAHRIFGLLPKEQAEEFTQLWYEYERRDTAEAKFAYALDRMQPILHNYSNEGDTWKKFNITFAQVYEKNKHIAEGSTELWLFVEQLIHDAVEKGYLTK